MGTTKRSLELFLPEEKKRELKSLTIDWLQAGLGLSVSCTYLNSWTLSCETIENCEKCPKCHEFTCKYLGTVIPNYLLDSIKTTCPELFI